LNRSGVKLYAMRLDLNDEEAAAFLSLLNGKTP
jgi:hypothetical protein